MDRAAATGSGRDGTKEEEGGVDPHQRGSITQKTLDGDALQSESFGSLNKALKNNRENALPEKRIARALSLKALVRVVEELGG